MAKQEQNDNIVTKSLPFELESNIFSRLPIKPLIRYQCVCKRWRDEIKHPSFMNSHHYHASKAFMGNSRGKNNDSLILFLCHSTPSNKTAFVTHSHRDKNNKEKIFLSADFHSSKDGLKFTRLPNLMDSLDNNHPFLVRNYDHPIWEHNYDAPSSVRNLVGCCNGFLLFQQQDFYHKMVHFWLYNPATPSNIRTLHHIVPNGMVTYNRANNGFGYDCTSDDYKILCLYYTDSYLYSFKTDSWKIIQCPPYLRGRAVYSNNALHWLAANSINHNNVDSIVSFDLGIGEYFHVSSLIESPIQHRCYPKWELVALRVCLHLVRYDTPFPHMTIWVMKGHGSTRSWTKLVKISFARIRVLMINESFPPIPCAYSEDGRELLISPGKSLPSFTCCDLQSGELRTVAVQIADYPDGILLREECDYRVMPWIGSLKQL